MYITFYLSYVIHCISYIIYIIHCISYIIYYTLHFIYHILYITFYISYIIHYISYIIIAALVNLHHPNKLHGMKCSLQIVFLLIHFK